jgi:hypothetical protein
MLNQRNKVLSMYGIPSDQSPAQTELHDESFIVIAPALVQKL